MTTEDGEKEGAAVTCDGLLEQQDAFMMPQTNVIFVGDRDGSKYVKEKTIH